MSVLDFTVDGDGTVCKYVIPSLNNDVNTSVYFTSLPRTVLYKDYYDIRKMKSDTLAASDTKIFHTEFAAGDYEAYVSEVPYANYSKSI